MLPYIVIAGRPIAMYGLMGMIGFAAALALISARSRRSGVDRENAVYLFVFIVIGAMLGAKLLYIFTVLPDFIADLPLIVENFSGFVDKYLAGGFVFYGGLIGGAAMAIGYCRFFQWRLADYVPVLVPAIPLMHAFGRIGCFCAGCCYGIEVSWGVEFTQAIAGPNGVPLFPVQLVEAACEFIICAVLVVVSRRGNALLHSKEPSESSREILESGREASRSANSTRYIEAASDRESPGSANSVRFVGTTIGREGSESASFPRRVGVVNGREITGSAGFSGHVGSARDRESLESAGSLRFAEPVRDRESSETVVFPRRVRSARARESADSSSSCEGRSDGVLQKSHGVTASSSWGILALYCLMYAPIRFVLEFVRGDVVRGFWMGMSTSQWLSIAVFIAAIIAVVAIKKAM